MADDFDRSFEFFQKSDQTSKGWFLENIWKKDQVQSWGVQSSANSHDNINISNSILESSFDGDPNDFFSASRTQEPPQPPQSLHEDVSILNHSTDLIVNPEMKQLLFPTFQEVFDSKRVTTVPTGTTSTTPSISVASSTAAIATGPPPTTATTPTTTTPTASSANTAEQLERVTVHVVMHEQLSAMYDDFSQEGAISVSGAIHVRPTPVTSSSVLPFCIVLKEVSANLQKLETKESVCEDISKLAHDNHGLHSSDRALRVKFNTTEHCADKDILLATYSCVTMIRPVPLLIKTRVRVTQQFARVGFKIRANPTNQCAMTNISIVMAVPPDVDGENVKTSRKGGSWEELKRTLCWVVDELLPGKALEIQAQFALLEGSTNLNNINNRVPKFPMLVRCDYPSLFSTLELSNEYMDDESLPVQFNISTSTRILHRKV